MHNRASTGLLVFAMLAAAPAVAGSGWTAPGRLAEVQVDDIGRVLARIETAQNPSGCGEAQWFIRVPGESTARMLDVLLAAARTGRPVRVYVNGSCHLKGYAEITGVSLSP